MDPKSRNPKKPAEVEEARKELQAPDMGKFDRAMRALFKTEERNKPDKKKKRD